MVPHDPSPPAKAAHLQLGSAGEDIAARYLTGIGCVIRERNVRFGRDEIDLIAYDSAEKMIVFVEVKTRTRTSDQYPIYTAVDKRKRLALRRAVNRWVIKHQYDGPGRIDVVCVCGDRIVQHLRDLGSDFY